MKRVLYILFIILIFLIGIKIGGATPSTSISSDLFESAKEEFESEIVIPDSNYENIDLVPKEYLPNKVANFINKLIEKITNKIA